MLANFTLTNRSDYTYKDFTVKCIHSALSGTVIDRNTHTIYELVKAHSTKKFRDVNLGFIHSHSQAAYTAHRQRPTDVSSGSRTVKLTVSVYFPNYPR
jgi:hypothetical protein